MKIDACRVSFSRGSTGCPAESPVALGTKSIVAPGPPAGPREKRVNRDIDFKIILKHFLEALSEKDNHEVYSQSLIAISCCCLLASGTGLASRLFKGDFNL